MRWDAATYGASFADIYDDWYGRRGDEAAVVDRVRSLVPEESTGRLLELGVGTGRLAVPLAADGWEVVGLDSSPDMLERLAANVAEVAARSGKTGATCAEVIGVLGDAADPDALPCGPFDVVLAAFNFLFNLPDRGAQRRCLAAAHAHARVGADGRLVIESFVPDPAMQPGRREATGPTTGVRVITDTDTASATVVGEHVGPDGRGRRWRVCFATPDEIDEMSTAAGWDLVERHEDWSGTPFEPDGSPAHVSVYRPARPPRRSEPVSRP